MLSNKWTFSLTSLVVLLRFRARFLSSRLQTQRGCKPSPQMLLPVVLALPSLSMNRCRTCLLILGFRSLQVGRVRSDAIPEITELEVAAGAGRIIVLATFEKEVHLQIVNPADLTNTA